MKLKDLASALGISASAVTRLCQRGMPSTSVAEAQAWRSANVTPYLRSERPESAQHAAPLPHAPQQQPTRPVLDLGQERAALAREQRVAIEIKNAVARSEYAPVALLAEVLAAASAAVAERFDHLPNAVRMACPDLPPAAIDRVLTVIADARNQWVSATAQLVLSQVFESESEADAHAQDDADGVVHDEG